MIQTPLNMCIPENISSSSSWVPGLSLKKKSSFLTSNNNSTHTAHVEHLTISTFPPSAPLQPEPSTLVCGRARFSAQPLTQFGFLLNERSPGLLKGRQVPESSLSTIGFHSTQSPTMSQWPPHPEHPVNYLFPTGPPSASPLFAHGSLSFLPEFPSYSPYPTLQDP